GQEVSRHAPDGARRARGMLAERVATGAPDPRRVAGATERYRDQGRRRRRDVDRRDREARHRGDVGVQRAVQHVPVRPHVEADAHEQAPVRAPDVGVPVGRGCLDDRGDLAGAVGLPAHEGFWLWPGGVARRTRLARAGAAGLSRAAAASAARRPRWRIDAGSAAEPGSAARRPRAARRSAGLRRTAAARGAGARPGRATARAAELRPAGRAAVTPAARATARSGAEPSVAAAERVATRVAVTAGFVRVELAYLQLATGRQRRRNPERVRARCRPNPCHGESRERRAWASSARRGAVRARYSW